MEKNVVTLRQLMNEAEAFEYSQEYYNLYKECMEADLMALWLESQEYRQYNDNLLRLNEGYQFNESYLVESASDDKIEAITEAWKEKVAGIKDKVVVWIKKCLSMLITFFKKLLNINNAKIEAYRKELEKTENLKILNDRADEVKKILAKNYNQYNKEKLWTASLRKDRGTFANKCKNISGKVEDSNVTYGNLLTLALVKDYVRITLQGSENNPVFELQKLVKDKGINLENINHSIIYGNYECALPMNVEEYKVMINHLEECKSSVESGEINNIHSVSGNKMAKEKYPDFIKACTNTIKIYQEVTSYRVNTIKELYALVKGKSVNAKPEDVKSEPENPVENKSGKDEDKK